MKIKELKKMLDSIENDELDILVSSDEELNTLFSKWEINYLEDIKSFVIFGYSGTELEV